MYKTTLGTQPFLGRVSIVLEFEVVGHNIIAFLKGRNRFITPFLVTLSKSDGIQVYSDPNAWSQEVRKQYQHLKSFIDS